MVKSITTLILILLASPTLADVNKDVRDCLNSAANTAGAKASCVQAAINKEEGNQITKMFQIYSNFVSQELNSGAFGSSGGSSGGASVSPNVTTPSAPPAIVQPPPPPPPVSQTPRQAPQGGIQYY